MATLTPNFAINADLHRITGRLLSTGYVLASYLRQSNGQIHYVVESPDHTTSVEVDHEEARTLAAITAPPPR